MVTLAGKTRSLDLQSLLHTTHRQYRIQEVAHFNMSAGPLQSALNLIRRMPPSQAENSLAGLLQLKPEMTDELLQHIDQPLKIEQDTKTGKEFIICDYNRDGDCYRSPWSNEYFPAEEDEPIFPPDHLRSLEIEANQIFDVYRKMYFEGGVSSAYFFETAENSTTNFGASWLVHKDVSESKSLRSGWWDSIHVFEVASEGGDKYVYKLTTTVMISMKLKDDSVGNVDLSGNMTKHTEKKARLDADNTHITIMGGMHEDMDLTLRNNLEGIYIQKTREVVNGMRNADQEKMQAWAEMTKSLGKDRS
jgi:capping protein beta